MKAVRMRDRLFDLQVEVESLENQLDRLQYGTPQFKRVYRELITATDKFQTLRKRIQEIEDEINEVRV